MAWRSRPATEALISMARHNHSGGGVSHEAAASGYSPPPELLDHEEEDSVWEQMSPRVYRNLDEIFAGEYEGMRSAMGNSGGAILRAVL